MKLKRRKAVEAPPKIKSFINNVTTTPFEIIEEVLKDFVWDFEKGDFHHWVDLFNYFDTFLEKYIKPRKDLQLEVNDLESDPPFPQEAVLQILRVIRIILENCTNKHFYSSYEHHLSSLLACTDADIVEACLQTLAAFMKKTSGKSILRDASLNSKLFAFAQGWGGKEEGLGLVACCAVESGSDAIACDLGSSLHFEFYSLNEHPNELPITGQHAQGLQIIHLPNINVRQESDLELLNKLVLEYNVPPSLRFSLFTRLRFARAFHSLASRQQYTCIRLYAFVVLVQACSDSDDLVIFFNNEPEFINELVTLISYETAVPEKIRILSIISLVAVCQDRARQPMVLTAVTSGGHRGILSSLMQKSVDSILNGSSKRSVVFAEALLSLVTVLVSSSSGCSAMREAGFIPTLLPLLKDMNPQHLHLVSMAVHVLEAFMDYSNPAATLFRDLGGLDDTILRLKLEVSHVENGCILQNCSSDLDISESSGSQVVACASPELDNMQPLYSEALVAYHRRLLIKALLRAISLGTYAPGATARISGSEESLLPHCLCILFRRAKDFGGGVFSLAATVMSDLIHKDPTCFAALDAAGLPSTFTDAIMDGVLCSAEAISCIPQCLDALCLNNNGLQAVKERNALRCFVKIFTSRTYLRALTADTLASLSSGLDELMRHASPLRVLGVEMLIEILNNIARLGSGTDSTSSFADSPSGSVNVPMETDADDKCMDFVDEKVVSSEQANEASSDASLVNTESFFPDCISNASRLLEAILQNSDTCRIFVDKKGIEAVLHLFTLPSMPLSVSVGQSISVAFKNFSQPHSASLARAVCSFLREHLKLTFELLVSLGGFQISQVEPSKRSKVTRCLSSLDGILSLANFLLKVTTAVVSELGTADSEVLNDLGGVYREILWQMSLYGDSKVDEKQSMLVESESPDVGVSNTYGRENDEDGNISPYGFLNPASVRSSSHYLGVDREFISVVRSTEGFNRRLRHVIARVRGGRTGRRLEALQIDSAGTATNTESCYQDLKKKSLEDLVLETLSKLALTICSFFTSLVKGFTSPNRRRTETSALTSASKCIGTALSKVFLDALGFSGYSTLSNLDVSLSLKCRYLGKVVDDMVPLVFDNRRRTCHTAMINNFYVHGTFKELLTTFEATSQLLWTLPFSLQSSGPDHHKAAEGSKLSQNLWLIETLQSYCRLLDCFVNSALVLSSTSASHSQLLVQPVAVGLSIGLFPVPKDPKVFVHMLQSQVMEVILPVSNHQLFPSCSPGLINSIISLITHVYSGVGDVKQSRSGLSGSTNQRLAAPPPDEGSIAAIVEMGFSRARAEEALRRVETNSIEMAMEWLFSHAEDPVQEDDELARALALSLGNSTETSKVDSSEKSLDVLVEEQQIKTPPVDEILAATLKLFYSSESVAFSVTDLLVTLCSRKKGENRDSVISFLVQQLNVCPVEFSKDNSALCMISHTLALLLSEDEYARDAAARSGVIPIAMNILMSFMATVECGNEILIPRCLSALLLILYNLLSRPKISVENVEETVAGVLPASSVELASSPVPEAKHEKKSTSSFQGEESGGVFEKVFGKPWGFLTIEESRQLLMIACNLIKQHVPAMVMQAVLQLCSRLTKTHALALQFLETGGLVAIFGLPRSCFFPGYDAVTSSIVRHLIEDPQTLQTAMELEIRQALGGNRQAARISVRTFLTSLAPVVCRDPEVFMKAAAALCHLESSGGRTTIVLSKEREKEKEKEKTKAAVVESGLLSGESVRISENKAQDGYAKCSKVLKKVPVNLTLVLDHLLDIMLAFPPQKNEVSIPGCPSAMEVDTFMTKVKGKSKVDEMTKVETTITSEKSAGLAKVSFVLKLLTDILLMYVHATGVILKRDLELSQPRASNQTADLCIQGGIVHHVLHNLLPLTKDKSVGPDEWRDKLSEKASYLLVVLSSRSGEGRRRVINELVKALSTFPNSESNSSQQNLFPSKEVLAFVDLVYAILSKNSSSGNLPGSGCSPDVAKSMIDGGMVQSLSSMLQVIDLDHPDAPKIVNIILKVLESLTRAANSSEHLSKSDSVNKKKTTSVGGRSDDNLIATPNSRMAESNANSSQLGVAGAPGSEQPPLESFQNATDQNRSPTQPAEREMRTDEESENANPSLELGMDFVREDMVEGNIMQEREHIGMTYHVENREDDDMGDEDDEMGDEGEDDEDDDEGEEEDGDIGEDGTALMSLADTDVEDHDDTGLGVVEYNEEMVDEEDDDFHDNRVIEVRWREALDGFDHLQVLGHPGSGGGLIDVAAEPFEGINVDDLFGLRRTFGYERRRQTSRTSFERPASSAASLQHPLLQRPSQSSDFVSSMRSGSGNLSRQLEAFSYRSLDASHFSMFDGPVLPYDNATSGLLGDRAGSSAPPPLADFSVGLESLHMPGHRGFSDDRWSDDGQLQGGGQAAVIAQAIEEEFISQLRGNTSDNPLARVSENQALTELQQADAVLAMDAQLPLDGDADCQLNCDGNREDSHHISQLGEGHSAREEGNSEIIADQAGVQPQSADPTVHLISEVTTGVGDDMEIGNENVNVNQQFNEVPSLVPPSPCSQADMVCGASSEALENPHHLALQVVGHDSPTATESHSSNHALLNTGLGFLGGIVNDASLTIAVDMSSPNMVSGENNQLISPSEVNQEEPVSRPNAEVLQETSQANNTILDNNGASGNGIDPTFLEALPEELRAEVLASQQAQHSDPPTYTPPTADDIDPEFLAALPPDIQAEVLAQQRAQRIAQQATGQPVEMDNASIIATFPAELREEVLLTSSEAVLSALPSPLLAEAQMLRDRAMSHYQARSLLGGSHRLNNRRNNLGFDRQAVVDRGVGVTIGRRVPSFAETLKIQELEGEPLLDASSLKALIRLLRLAQPLGKGLLQRLLLNLCAHSSTRAILVRLLLDTMKPEHKDRVGVLRISNSFRLYGCKSSIVYGRSQLFDGLPPLVLRRVLEILTYLANNHSAVASLLCYFDPSLVPETSSIKCADTKKGKGKEKIVKGGDHSSIMCFSGHSDIPLILFLKLLSQPLFLLSIGHLEQVMGLLQVVVHTAASKWESQSHKDDVTANSLTSSSGDGGTDDAEKDASLLRIESDKGGDNTAASKPITTMSIYDIFLQLPQSDLHNLCSLLGHAGLSDKVYLLTGEVVKKLASVAAPLCKFFILELSGLAQDLSSSAVNELVTLRTKNMLGLSAGLMAGAALLRVLQILSSFTSSAIDSGNNEKMNEEEQEQHAAMWKLNAALEPLWQELSECISNMETELAQGTFSSALSNINSGDVLQGSSVSSALPPGTQRLLPFIEAFFVLCEKLQANNLIVQQDHGNATAREVKESASISDLSSSKSCHDAQRRVDGASKFTRFAEKHRRLLNAFIRQNPGLLEKSLSMLLRAPRLIDFDNKRAYFRSRIRQQHEQHLSGPLRISIRRAYVLEDSYNQLRMRPTQDLKGRLNVHFQGEEGIDAGGLTREWYQLLSRVIFDKGALLFTTVGNNATFQPNPNSVYQTEHLSYFKFVGRVVAKALFDGQLLDVYFTRSFYKHILGVKVTYHDIEAVDPDYYKNLKWMLENDVSDIPDLTFSMDADEEKHILYEKTEVTDYELKPGGRNSRVTEETKHEYVDLVADHLLTNAIRPQINSFLEGFNELVPRDIISIFNDKELELLISGLPEIDLDDLKANTEYTGYTAASIVVQWFWEVIRVFNKEDRARLLQFVTGTSKVPLEGFKALQGISGPQRFQIHKAYGAPDRLPSAHTCFNQLDLPEYTSREQLQERLLLAIHEASEGFGFG